jgi:hypothetical protein
MTGLYFDIRNCFDSKYSGRYLAILLEKTFERQRGVLLGLMRKAGLRSELIDELKTRSAVVTPRTEHRLRGASGDRRADLAILINGTPRILVEIKEDDVGSKSNAAQISDYLRWIRMSKEPKVAFIIISRFPLKEKERVQVESARLKSLPVYELRYHEIVSALKHSDQEPPAQMLCEYLEDIRVTTYRSLELHKNGADRTAMMLLLNQMLGFPHAHGLGRLNSDNALSKGPSLITQVMNNLQIVGERLQIQNRYLTKVRPTREFVVIPHFDLQRLHGTIGKFLGQNPMSARKPDRIPGSRGQFVRSGEVDFFLKQRLQADRWLYLCAGIIFNLNRIKSNSSLKWHLWAGFQWPGTENDYFYDTKTLDRYPTEEKFLAEVRKLVKKSRDAALETLKKDLKNRKIIQAIEKFEVN